MRQSPITPLDEASLASAALELAGREPFFAGVLERHGTPPLWSRPPGFSTLVWIILEQQVSLASARAAFERLQGLLPDFTPEAFLKLADAELRAAGFSRQKTAYSRGVAEAIANRRLDIDRLAEMEDHAALAELVRLKGIGRWTADVYMLMAHCRPDIWPVGDLGLVVAVRHAFGFPQTPNLEEMQRIGVPWKPYRAVAARLLWQYYLNDLPPGKRIRKAQSNKAEISSTSPDAGSSLDSPASRAKL